MKVQSDVISTWARNFHRTPVGMRGILYSCWDRAQAPASVAEG